MNWFDKNKFFEKLLIFVWIFFLFFVLFLFSTISHASGGESESYFPMEQNYNERFRSDDISVIENYFDFENKDILVVFSDFRDLGYAHMTWFWVYQITKESDNLPHTFGEISSNGYQFSLYEDSEYGPTVTRYCWDSYSQYMSVTNSGSISTLQNLDSSLYNSNADYISNFKIYTSNNINNRGVVLKYGADDPEPIPTGEARKPFFNHNPEYAIGEDPPTEVPPSYTVNNYTWNTYNPPAIDNSSTIAAIESLGDVLTYNSQYLKDNLSGEFNNLISNLQGLITYIGETIQYYGDLIIGNIQDSMTNFYENMAALVQPILEKIDYFTEEIDGTIIYDNISSTSLVTNISTINGTLTTFTSSFNELSEPNSYTIPIHLENLPSAWFGNQTTQYIDLGVIDPVKSIIRLFMWAIITYSLFITIVDSISNYINGGGDES